MFTKWDERFIKMAEFVAGWSSCYQDNRKIGAVIVRDKRILTTGYNGSSWRDKELCGKRRVYAQKA